MEKSVAGRRRRPCRRSRSTAFTLVELLVVIGIIAILISVLLPVLASARKAGYKTKCLAALKQMGDAYKMYQLEFKGDWPVSGHFFSSTVPAGAPTGRDKRWHDFIGKYLIGNQKVESGGTVYTSNEVNFNGTAGYPQVGGLHGEFGTQWDPVWIGTMRDRNNVLWGCPSWSRINAINNSEDYRNCGYQMSRFIYSPNDVSGSATSAAFINEKVAFINDGTVPGAGSVVKGRYFKMTSWKQQAERCLIFEGIHGGGFFSANVAHTWPWTPQNFPEQPDATAFPVDYNRHGKRAKGNKMTDISTNILYCDGHAATVSAKEAYRALRMHD